MKPMKPITAVIFTRIAVLLSVSVAVVDLFANVNAAEIQNKIPRKDSAGEIMDAHDGCLEFFKGRYYLYGTKYGDTNGFTESNRYVCYSSKDLMTWQYHGEILKSPPKGVYYRPYVKFNGSTGKYVLWYNWYPTLWNGQYGVAVADAPGGPFEIVNDNVNVRYAKPGDHGLFVDDDGTGFLIYTSIDKKHGISIEKLTPDYLASTLEGSDFLASGCEACSMVKRGSVYYAVFDTCCCFCPGGTGAKVYTAKSPLGPYQFQNNINRDANGNVIIPAQQNHIAQLHSAQGTVFIWMGDLWGSQPDGVKGHDLQYWSKPLIFDANDTIMELSYDASWTIQFE